MCCPVEQFPRKGEMNGKRGNGKAHRPQKEQICQPNEAQKKFKCNAPRREKRKGPGKY